MQKLLTNSVGERIEFRDFQPLTESIDETDYPHSAQSIAALAGRICASVLSCDGGGIGVFDQMENRIALWIPVGGQNPAAAKYYHGGILNADLIDHWLDSRQLMFVDKQQQPQFLPKSSGFEVENIILDGIFKQDDSMVCFYCLTNVDKYELTKYQIIMKLLLSSLSGALRRLAERNVSVETVVEPLTEREQQIIIHIRAGLNNKTIARRLNISVNTVKCHIYNIFQKLNASNRVEAIIKARQAGYVA